MIFFLSCHLLKKKKKIEKNLKTHGGKFVLPFNLITYYISENECKLLLTNLFYILHNVPVNTF